MDPSSDMAAPQLSLGKVRIAPQVQPSEPMTGQPFPGRGQQSCGPVSGTSSTPTPTAAATRLAIPAARASATAPRDEATTEAYRLQGFPETALRPPASSRPGPTAQDASALLSGRNRPARHTADARRRRRSGLRGKGPLRD